ETIHVHWCSGGCGELSIRGSVPAGVQESYGHNSSPVAENAAGIQHRSLPNAPVIEGQKQIGENRPARLPDGSEIASRISCSVIAADQTKPYAPARSRAMRSSV